MVKTTVMAEATGHTFWPGPASHGRFLPVSAALGLCICCPCASIHHPPACDSLFPGISSPARLSDHPEMAQSEGH